MIEYICPIKHEKVKMPEEHITKVARSAMDGWLYMVWCPECLTNHTLTSKDMRKVQNK